MVKKNTGASNSIFNLIIAIVMIGVIGLAGYAVYTTLYERNVDKKIESGEMETTLERMAESAGLTIDEFKTNYGISEADLDKKSTESEVLDKMTLTKYAEYKQTTVDDILAETFLEGKATGDTVYEDFKKLFTVRSALAGNEEQFNQMKELYELDDTITMDTLWSEAEPVIMEKMQQAQQNAQKVADEKNAEAAATQETTDAEDAE